MEPILESATIKEPVKVDENELTPEQIARGAYEASELSADNWNGLSDEARDAKIVAHLDQIRANADDANSASSDGAPSHDAADDEPAASEDDTPEPNADAEKVLEMPTKGIEHYVKENNLDEVALKRLIAAEESGKKRVGVLKLLNEALTKDSDNPPAAGAKDDEGGKEARGEVAEKPWQKPDYTGPLSADQALWRGKNIKLK